MEDDKIKISAFLVQGASAISISCLPSLTGLIAAWPSYTIEKFISNETILSHPMSSNEISILSSLTNIGALIATPFCGYAVNTYGRKYAAMLFGLPFVLAWTIISLTTYVPLVIAAVGLAGVGAAGQAVSSVYISEISHDSIRGGLSSFVLTGYFVGLLISYFLGGQLTYYQVVYAHLSISILYVVMVMLLKDSPVFLVQKGRIEEAAKSIAFYRQVDVTSKEVEVAINKIKLQLDPRIEKILQGEKGSTEAQELIINTTGTVEPSESAWKFLKKSESSKRALATVLILMAANTLMGAIVLQVYAEPLFIEAVPSMPSNLCSIFLAVAWMISCISCAAIVDRCGRKFLMTYTSLGSGICTLALGIQLEMHYAPPWFTAAVIYAFCYVNYLGAATVPFILAGEVFLPEVRGLGNSLATGVLWISNFLCLMTFNPLLEAFGLGALFYGFTAVCFLTALYSQCCLPETKGLSAVAIQPLFMKKKKREDFKA